MDQPLPDIAVSRLTIADSQGRARIVLGLQPDGEPAILLLSLQGQELACLGLTKGLRATDGKSETVVVAELQLGAVDGGAQFIAQASPLGEGSIELTSGPDEQFAAILLEVDQLGGNPRAGLSVRDPAEVVEAEASGGRLLLILGRDGAGGTTC